MVSRSNGRRLRAYRLSFSSFVIVVHDLRHKLVKRVSPKSFKDFQLVLFQLGIFGAFCRYWQSAPHHWFSCSVPAYLGGVIGFDGLTITFLPAFNRRFADITDRSIGFVLVKKRFYKLFNFRPQKNCYFQLFKQVKDLIRFDTSASSAV